MYKGRGVKGQGGVIHNAALLLLIPREGQHDDESRTARDREE